MIMKIPTRYLVLGIFDGVTLAFSLLISVLFSGVLFSDAMKISIAAAIGMFASNFFGAYYAEMAESYRKFGKLEKKMAVKEGYLDDTLFYHDEMAKILSSSLTNGLSAFIFALLPLILIFFFGEGAILFTIIALFGAILLLGMYFSKLMREHLLLSIVKIISIVSLIVILNYFSTML